MKSSYKFKTLAKSTPHNGQQNWLVDPLSVVFYFPFLVSLGAGASLSAKHHKINKFSGDISYPLYMTHYPFMWVFANYVVAKQPSMTQLAWVVPISTILLIILAYLVSEFMDLPIRRYFTQKLKSAAKRKS